MKKLLWAGLALLALAPSSFAELVLPDAPNGYVLDEANILSPETEAQLQTDLAALQTANSSQLVVVTVTDLQGYEPEQYALALGRAWGVGQDEFNNGLVFLIAPNDQVARIEVGYGLEGAITDAQSSMILNQVAIPYFKDGNYDQGVLESMSILETLAKGEAYDLSQLESSTSTMDFASILLFVFLPLGWAIISMLAGTKSWWLGGVFGGVFGILVAGLTGLIMGALTGLFVDYMLSTYFFGKITSHSGSSSSGFWRGGGGFGGSSGGGFGGFGGGSFGGGGASGRW